MVENNDVALGILKRAMTIEQEGRQFYLKAVQTTQDKDGQEVFSTLANEEQRHFDLINRQQAALIGQGRWLPSAEIKPVTIDLSKPLFPKGRDALEKAISSKSTDWDALLFGLDIETKSYDFYRKAVEQIQAPIGKQMLEFLAGQEQSHFSILMMRYEALFGPTSWRY